MMTHEELTARGWTDNGHYFINNGIVQMYEKVGLLLELCHNLEGKLCFVECKAKDRNLLLTDFTLADLDAVDRAVNKNNER